MIIRTKIKAIKPPTPAIIMYCNGIILGVTVERVTLTDERVTLEKVDEDTPTLRDDDTPTLRDDDTPTLRDDDILLADDEILLLDKLVPPKNDVATVTEGYEDTYDVVIDVENGLDDFVGDILTSKEVTSLLDDMMEVDIASSPMQHTVCELLLTYMDS